MRGLREERGFLLLEVLFLTTALLAFSGVFFAYRLSASMHEWNKSRIAALCLAEEQIAYVVERGTEGRLSPGKIPWLASEKEPPVDRHECAVDTEISEVEKETGVYLARVTVTYRLRGKIQEVRLERMVRNVVPKDGYGEGKRICSVGDHSRPPLSCIPPDGSGKLHALDREDCNMAKG